MAASAGIAVAASVFINTLGVNTHIDFNRYGYQNLPVVESSLQYLGVHHVRDSAENVSDYQSWPQVASVTGVKFDDFMPEGSPGDMLNALGLVPRLAGTGILEFIEGGNEEDDPYPQSRGNSLSYTAYFQTQVFNLGRSLGLPVINMSFGAGWTPLNNWQGNYGAVGDLSTYADYGNAHTYPNVNQQVDGTIRRLNTLAALAAKSRPIMTTEVGWNEDQGFSQADVAKRVLNAAMDGWKNGDAKTYFYALFDDGAGKFGLMNQDGTPKPAGTALHNLTTLLTDQGTDASTFAPGTLSFQLAGAFGDEQSILFQKSDGSFWVAVWDEVDGTHSVTLTLNTPVAQIQLVDPLTGTNAIQTASNTGALTLNLVDHPLLVHIVPATTTVSNASATNAASTFTALVAAATPQPPTPNVVTSLTNNGTVTGNAGTMGIYVYGTGNTIMGTANTGVIQAFKGGNTIYSGPGSPTIRIAGSNNKVFAGDGITTVADSGTNNTITFGKIGSGTVFTYGYLFNQGDTLDLKAVIAGTQWTKDPTTIGNFLSVTAAGSYSIVRVNPSGLPTGVTYPIAVLNGYGYLTLPALLAHASL